VRMHRARQNSAFLVGADLVGLWRVKRILFLFGETYFFVVLSR
jgi:hypothetical protein